jgi:hypothetical protein
MEAAVAWLVQHRPDVTLEDYTIEFR